MRSYILRPFAAALTFGVGTLLAAVPQFLTPQLLTAPGHTFLTLLARLLGAFWTFVLAFASGKDRSDFLFALIMLGCGSTFLLAALATLAGVLFNSFRL